MTELETLQQWINESERAVFFGGAGVSTESGIPDFRGVDGLYRQQYDCPPEEIISHSFFIRRPEEFYRFYKERMLYPDVTPNATHRKLAELERAGHLAAVVTQNIDGLHQAAGSRQVYELHGSVHRNYCVKCHAFFDAAYVQAADGVPKCNACGNTVKPDVVLYEEGLDPDTLRGAAEVIAAADLLIVGGTSLTVYPAAGLIHNYRGNRLVLINLTATACDSRANLVIYGKLGDILGQMKALPRQN